MQGVKLAVLLDREAEGLTGEELRGWRRPTAIRGATCRSSAVSPCSTPAANARGRRDAPRGSPMWPSPRPRRVARVDARWAEYGLGEPMASPSERYRRLLLSDKAEW